MRTIIIGDIHGCDRAFAALLDATRINPARDTIVLLGDILDRGPNAWGVYQRVVQISESMGDRFVLLRGNHEAYWLQKNPTIAQKILHSRVGRGSTIASFREHGADLSECARWIEAHSVLYYKQDAFQCAHAGVCVEPIERNDPDVLLHDHSIVRENRYQGKLTITGHLALREPAWFMGDGKNIQKLASRREYELPRRGVICIDTGCCMGGTLTAMAIENDRFMLFAVQ